jgi:uncharacterized Zn-binding protein involved in type VI secretion
MVKGGAARVNDPVEAKADVHGGACCPHQVKGFITTGSKDVFINGQPAARVGDTGMHTACCGPNIFVIAKGSETVFINDKKAARARDPTLHCGGSSGEITQGSNDVIIDSENAG